jgi:hypothetical protein
LYFVTSCQVSLCVFVRHFKHQLYGGANLEKEGTFFTVNTVATNQSSKLITIFIVTLFIAKSEYR